jgi:hypothetical protein
MVRVAGRPAPGVAMAEARELGAVTCFALTLVVRKLHRPSLPPAIWRFSEGSPNGRSYYSFYSIGYRTKKLLLYSAKLSTKFEKKN